MNMPFDFSRLNWVDRDVASQYIGSLFTPPDLVIAPAGHGEYLFRWHVVPHNREANVYFHIQTQSDPERPLHDHPWDSTSVILSGGYGEIIQKVIRYENEHEELSEPEVHRRQPGDVIFRPATWAHRLILPDNVPYSMSLFTTGPKVRDWGFWTKAGWRNFEDVTEFVDGKSVWKKEYQE